VSFLDSLLIGMSIGAVPGPIFFELTRRTLAKGFWHGFLLAVGEFFSNFILILLTFFSLSAVLTSTFAKELMLLFGAGVLLYVGLDALRYKPNENNEISGKDWTKSNSVIVGFVIGITNPVVLALWISLGGAHLAQSPASVSLFIDIVLMALGVALFFLFMAAFLHLVRKKISLTHVAAMSKIAGVIIIFYGLYFLYQFALLSFGSVTS